MSIDAFFISLATVHKELAVGILLSGLGSDGTLGLKAIKEHGGITLVQDQESAIHGTMPQNAVDTNLVDFVLSPEEIPEKLLEIMWIKDSGEEIQDELFEDEAVIKQILSLLMQRSGVDFTYYKQTTIRRRIARRMAIVKIGKLADYLINLRKDAAEQQALFQNLLIPVRIWIAGCSTGQEAFSIATSLMSFWKINLRTGVFRFSLRIFLK